jgi:preprotein translocase subunit SecA
MVYNYCVNDTGTNKFFDLLSTVSELPKQFITSFMNLALSGQRNRLLADLEKIAHSVMALGVTMSKLSDEELKAKTADFQKRLQNNQSLDSIMVEAFAVAREASKRVLNEEHYKVQIMGGAALHKGMIAEMKTGEGKTLVGVLPAYLNALTGKGVHIVTVNDYLARRDAEWMGRIFEFLGLTVGCITNSLSQSQKRSQYDCDITYCTNNELGFDFLRDNMITSKNDKAQRELNFCIVDEADSVLIDEARTPLIISGPTENTSDGYLLSDTIVKKLEAADYEINLKEHQAHFTDVGIESIEKILRDNGHLAQDEPLYTARNSVLLHQLSQSLKANHLYRLGVDYIIEKDYDEFYGSTLSIKIIDEHTGRTLHGRRYSDGLHQALEAKEGVTIMPESETLASVTFQRLFKMYNKLSGMTGTALTESEEFEKTYKLKCIDIPTNIPKRRIDYDDAIYISKKEKIKAIIELVRECHMRGQPVIVGTTTVESSEEFGYHLNNAGFKADVLNAKNHQREAEIVANAGRFGSVTVVTNMAGRGTDIKLGGDLKMLLKKATYGVEDEEERNMIELKIRRDIEDNKARVIGAGGLFVVGVEHNNNRRIDNQLRGRSGRQGDAGASKFFMCTEDDLIRKFNPNMADMLRTFGATDDEVLEHPWLTSSIATAQKRMEAYNFEARQSLQRYSDIKEFYMLKFYEKRAKVLDKDVMSEIVGDFEDMLRHPKQLDKLKKLLGEDHISAAQLRFEFYSNLKRYEKEYKENATKVLRRKVLHGLDSGWKKYLVIMSNTKDAVSFQSYAQKDPLIAFYNIAKDKFEYMMDHAQINIIHDIIRDVEQEDDSDEESELMNMLRSMNDKLKLEIDSMNADDSEVQDIYDQENDSETEVQTSDEKDHNTITKDTDK